MFPTVDNKGGKFDAASSAKSGADINAGINVGGFNVPSRGFKTEHLVIGGLLLLGALFLMKKK